MENNTKSFKEIITKKLYTLMKDYQKNGNSTTILRALLLLTVEYAEKMGIEVELDFVDFTYNVN